VNAAVRSARTWPTLFATTVLRPITHAPARHAIAVVAIALGVALGFAIYLVNRVASDEVQRGASSLFGLADLSVQAPGLGFDETLYPTLARIPGVAAASPMVEVTARLPGREASLKVVGIDAFRARALQPAVLAGATGGGNAGTALLSEDHVWISPAAARMLDLGAGDELIVQAGLDDVRLEVAGLLPAAEYPQPIGVVDIATAQWRLHRLGRLDRVDLRLHPGADLVQVRHRIASELPPGVRVVTPTESIDEAVSLTRAYRSNLTALALVALFTGGFLVYATQSLAFARRRREFALLHAIGVTRREQLLASLAGGALLGVLGAALGLAAGFGAARLGLATLGADLGAGYFRGVAPVVEPTAIEWLTFFGLGVVAATLASLGPAREAAAVPTAAALKAGDEVLRPARHHVPVAALLLAGAILTVMLRPIAGLPLPGYVAIALFLLASVLLTPVVCELAYARLPPSRVAWRTIAIAQLRGTASRANVSVAAILVSFSLMVAMAIMVSSFRVSLDVWMQRVLPADLYVRVGSASQSAYLDREAQQTLREIDGIRRLEVVRYVDVVMDDGRPLTVIARSIDVDSADRVLMLRKLAREPAPTGTIPVWLSEAAADLHGLDAGSRFELPLAGRRVAVSVRALWRDYELRPGGGVVIDRNQYIALTGDERAATASLWLERDASVPTVVADVREKLGRGEEVAIADPRDIRRQALQAFDRTFAVTYLLEAIAVAIGLFGIAASAGSQVLARRAEFGMLRHLGVTRGEILRMLAFEGAMQGVLGALMGLVVGTVVGLVLIYVVNRQSFHWSMDLHVPWLWLTALSLALVACAAATAAWAGRGALRDDVVRAVKDDW
jgi:putative ABC transport system permease protein